MHPALSKVAAVAIICFLSITAYTLPVSASEPSVVPHGVSVIGGQMYRKGQYSFVVALRSRINDKPFCTGAVIGDRWIITAHHCFFGEGNKEIDKESFYVSTGRTLDEGEKFYADKVVHYHLNVLDISLVKVTGVITSRDVKSVPIQNERVRAGVTITAVGWGFTAYGGDYTKFARKATKLSGLLVQTACTVPATSAQFCVSFNFQRGLTNGDSGSPGLVGSVDSPALVGVFNSGNQQQGVYTRSSDFYEWVQSTMKNN
jgi:secreted trypsin-like serine protease